MIKADAVGTSSIVDSLLAQLKLVNAAPDTAAINALVDGVLTFANVPYQAASAYQGVPSGMHTVTVEAAATPGAVIASAQPTFAAATDTSIFVSGIPGAQTAVVLTDTNLPGTAGRARLRFVNAGLLTQNTVSNTLHVAGIDVGKPEDEISAVIEWAMDHPSGAALLEDVGRWHDSDDAERRALGAEWRHVLDRKLKWRMAG